jgi:hypothetical protein
VTHGARRTAHGARRTAHGARRCAWRQGGTPLEAVDVDFVYVGSTQNFFFSAKHRKTFPNIAISCDATKLSGMFKSLPLSIREVRATEVVLERIYQAAYLGLKGDSLALNAGLLPAEYNRLKELDQTAELAELKGRADAERAASEVLYNAAQSGDAKAALSILQHAHGWVAKQAISVEVDQRISVIGALRAAEERVINAETHLLTGR